MQKKLLNWLEKDLFAAGMQGSAKEYLQKAFSKAAMLAIAAWFAAALAVENIAVGAAIGLLCGLAAFSLLLLKPRLEKKKVAALFEKELPFALLSMSTELNLNVPLEKSISGIAAEKEFGIVAKEFKKVLRELNEGASLQEALQHLSERIGSLNAKRAIAQLVNIFEQGGAKGRGEPLKRLAAELLAKQRAEAKEFSGKLVVFSLLFIAVSAIVPALFQSFVIIGSMFLEMRFTALQVLLIVALGFPMIDLAILLFIKQKTPMFLREQG